MTQPVYGGDTHWRNSMKMARLGPLDARAAIPLVFTLLHFRIWTICLAVFTTLIFYILEQRGMSFDAALRALRVWFVSKKRPNITHSNRHRMVDYAWEPWPEKFKDEPLEEEGAAPAAAPPAPEKKSVKPRTVAGAKPKKVIRPATAQPATSRTGAK